MRLPRYIWDGIKNLQCVVHELAQHPVAEDQEGADDSDHLRDDDECLLIDLGHRLKDSDHETDDQPRMRGGSDNIAAKMMAS